ncbi:MAG: hypothetical protein AB8G11_10935 [Saprospiraceae bacterium]
MKKIYVYIFILSSLFSLDNTLYAQANLDTDGDGIADINDLDDDNDGILDTDEGFCFVSPQLIGSTTAQASGAGTSGIPNLSYTIPSGSSRMMYVAITVERDHTPSPYADNWESNVPFTNSFSDIPSISFGGVNLNKWSYSSTFVDFDGSNSPGSATHSMTTYIYTLFNSSMPTGNQSFNFSNFNTPTNTGDEMQVSVFIYDGVWNLEFININEFLQPGSNTWSITGNPTANTQPAGTAETDNILLSYAAVSTSGGITGNSPWTTITSNNVINGAGTYATDPNAVTSTENDGISTYLQTLSGITGTQTATYTTGSNDALFQQVFMDRITPQPCTITDIDGDGTPDYLDLDSDNDGCPDALEGTGTFTYSDIQNDTLTGDVGSNGVPIAAGAGQGIGDSRNNTIRSGCQEICNDGIDNDGDGLIDCIDPDCPTCNYTCADGVQLLSQKIDTKIGAGTANIPSITNLTIPEGNSRAIFILVNFEREHCQGGDDCNDTNTAGIGLGDNFASPTFSSGNYQITANFIGSGGNVGYQNPLSLPDGDLRFGIQNGYPTPPDPNILATFYSRESYFIAIYESDINTILGGAASGTIDVTLPDVNAPLDDADETIMYAFVFENVQESNVGIVRSGVNTSVNAIASSSTSYNGNYTITDSDFDNGQEPDEAEDGVLVLAVNGLGSSNIGGFDDITGYTKIAQNTLTNIGGDYTPNNEGDGFSASVFFRQGPSTGIIDNITVQSSAPTSIQSNGGMLFVFTLQSCFGSEICNNGIDDDGDGLIDCADSDCILPAPGAIIMD